MRDGIERAAEAIDLPMWIERVGIERVSNAERPCQLLRDFPRVLCAQVKIQKVERFIRRRGESLCRRGCDSVNVLRQSGVRHGGRGSLAEVEIVQPKDSRIRSEP